VSGYEGPQGSRGRGRPGAASGESSSRSGNAASGADRDEVLELAREVVRFVPDVVVMLRGVLEDERVPRSAKLQTGALLAYIASPIDVIPDFVPVLGQLDDGALAALAVRRLLTAAGEPVLRDHWRGSERGLQMLLALASALAVPSRTLRRIGVAGAVSHLFRRETRTEDGHRVVDGEVVRRRRERADGA
jgi:uncharacterized membrane protein YkvA (DUF1232 family)